MTTGRGGYKRELTISGGLMTPNSFASASEDSRSTITPKREGTHMTSIDNFEDPHPSTEYGFTNHGLPTEASFARHDQASSNQLNHSDPPSPMSSQTLSGGEGLKVLGYDVNRIVNFMDKLRRIGLKSVDGRLPELVLVGDQSAGKSSLMSAIAEIHLPKKAAMCTRCPFNIKTSPSEEWECTVSTQEDHVYNPSWRKGPFPKWQPSPEETTTNNLFATINKKSELEEVLTWAQIALLNPSKDLKDFVPGSAEQVMKNEIGDESIEVQYSPNVIAVEIRGPGLPALSFFDLPGLFQDAGASNLQFLVKVFDAMTIKYIEHPHAIIICTLSMANDAALSKTKRIIGEHKVDHKCIGVLTMPDRMQGEASSHEDYNGIFNRTSHKLPRGYYVTKQPGPDCRLDKRHPNYHALARQEEERYFDQSPHWGPDGEWSTHRNRCGTGTIQRYLSKEFARKILHSIPGLTENIAAQVKEVDEALKNLPEIAHDQVQKTVRDVLLAFTDRAQAILKGKMKYNTFHSDWQKLCVQFLKAIEVMRPGCICTHPSDFKKEVIRIDLDSDTESVVSQRPSQTTPTGNKRQRDDAGNSSNRDHKRPRIINTPIPFNINTPSRLKYESGSMSAPLLHSPAARKLKKDEIGPFHESYLDSGFHALSIGGLREDLVQASPAGVPGFIDHDVKKDFALLAIHKWEGPLQTFVDATFAMVRTQILAALSWALQQHQKTEIYEQSMAYIEEFLADHAEKQRVAMMEYYDIEKESLFTVNREAFDRHQAEAHEALKQSRREQRVKAYTEVRLGKESRFLDDPERAKKEKDERKKFMDKVTDAQLGPDPFAPELEVAAYIRGYYTTARYRFTDSVCLGMHNRYFRSLILDIKNHLEGKYALNSGDAEATCMRLLESNPEMSRQRVQLQHRKRQLADFSRNLDEFKAQFSEDEDFSRSDYDIEDGELEYGVDPGRQNGRSNFMNA